VRRRLADTLERQDPERQVEKACAPGEDGGIAEAGEPRGDWFLREADADVGPDAGGLAAGERDARELICRVRQIFFWT
jgi:hypothetical protein